MPPLKGETFYFPHGVSGHDLHTREPNISDINDDDDQGSKNQLTTLFICIYQNTQLNNSYK